MTTESHRNNADHGGYRRRLADDLVGNDEMNTLLAQNWWAIALRGVLTILFGLLALFLPGPTLASLVLLYAAYMLVDGIFAIAAGVNAARRRGKWGWLILEGIVDLIASAIAFIWPLATILAFVYLMGAWGIVSGVLMTAGAFQHNVQHGRWLLAFGGAVSVLWGILLMLWPFTGALVLTWWMGAYALFFGGALLALAFRLRRRRNEQPGAHAVPGAA
jgi:uncharacterized membrane protein HdeD (DUF308 family)